MESNLVADSNNKYWISHHTSKHSHLCDTLSKRRNKTFFRNTRYILSRNESLLRMTTADILYIFLFHNTEPSVYSSMKTTDIEWHYRESHGNRLHVRRHIPYTFRPWSFHRVKSRLGSSSTSIKSNWKRLKAALIKLNWNQLKSELVKRPRRSRLDTRGT